MYVKIRPIFSWIGNVIFHVFMLCIVVFYPYTLLYLILSLAQKPQALDAHYTYTFIFAIAVFGGIYFYWLRTVWQKLYGILEVVVGAVVVVFSIVELASNVPPGTGGGATLPGWELLGMLIFSAVLKVAGGLYIVVRGLDNIDKGLKDGAVKRQWRKFFTLGQDKLEQNVAVDAKKRRLPHDESLYRQIRRNRI